jgi:GNAT superfamily N-acetyltransferase
VGAVEVRRARIEEIRPLAAEYKVEQEAQFGAPTNAPLPQGGIFWLATDDETREALGYAAGTLRPTGCTIGPVFTRANARRRGVGDALLRTIQRWARGHPRPGGGDLRRGRQRGRARVPRVARVPTAPRADVAHPRERQADARVVGRTTRPRHSDARSRGPHPARGTALPARARRGVRPHRRRPPGRPVRARARLPAPAVRPARRDGRDRPALRRGRRRVGPAVPDLPHGRRGALPRLPGARPGAVGPHPGDLGDRHLRHRRAAATVRARPRGRPAARRLLAVRARLGVRRGRDDHPRPPRRRRLPPRRRQGVGHPRGIADRYLVMARTGDGARRGSAPSWSTPTRRG